ncbi:MAG: DUF2273 domain-containing protein [Clostridia bacterium]|nr:DUF2273 domain-containing protein [Clostridia bacterium]
MDLKEDKIEIPEIDDDSKNFAYYITQYRGAIIGIIISLFLIATGFTRFIINLIILIVSAFIGNYIQRNKSHVKQSLKKFIDRF